MYIINIVRIIKKMSFNEIKNLSLKTIINELDFLKKTLEKNDLLLLANKLIENIPDPRNAKEHYQSFIRKKNRKSVKQSEIIIY